MKRRLRPQRPPQKLLLPEVAVPIPDPAPAPPAKGKPRGSWTIQVGAFDTKTEAKQRLSTAQDRPKDQLGHASAVTESTEKGDKTMYRARFAGLDRNQAEDRLQEPQAQRHSLHVAEGIEKREN